MTTMRILKLLALVIVAVLLGTVLFYFLDFRVNSTGEVGARGRDMLRGPYFIITVEIDYMTGYRPDPAALQKFADFVALHTRKSVVIVEQEIPASQSKEPYTRTKSQTFTSSIGV